MGFVDNLAANSGGGSGIYGQPGIGGSGAGDALDLVNKLKDRELNDFKNKANFMSELSVRQDRMRNRFMPSPTGDVQVEGANMQQGMPPQGRMNTVMAPDPNQITGYQKGELGIRQQGLNLDKQKLAQAGQMGEEKIGIQRDQQALNQQKSDQIYQSKIDESNRKSGEAQQKFEAMQAELERKTKAGDDTIQLHKDMMKQVKLIKELDDARRQHEFDRKTEQHQQTIDELKRKNDMLSRSSTTTEVDASGNKKTVTTKKGDAAEMVDVIGPNGQKGRIPKDKLDDWNKNHKPQDEE